VLSSVEQYDPAKNAWEAVAPTSTARCALAAAVVDGKLYATGGFDSQIRLFSSVEQYHPAKDEWVAMASMALITKRSCFCAVSM
jgi:N-acetylneuraminic acid mutarotase